MRLMLLLLFACAAGAQDDPLRTWQKAQSSIDRDEHRFWKDFKSRFNEALEDFGRPVSDARDKPDLHKDAVYDYAGLEGLYNEAKGLAEARATADDLLAASGNDKACATLFAALLKGARKMDAIEADLADPVPDYGSYTFNQDHGCRLWGMRTLTTRRAAALGKCANAVPFLTGEAWKKAKRADGRKSFRRRVFVLDALASARSEASIPFLRQAIGDKTPAVRIAAIEAVAPHGKQASAALAPAWADPDPAVRRALLESLPALPTWFGAVLGHAKGAKGAERDLCVRYLGSVSGQPFGHDLPRWREWYGEYRTELEGGKFDPETIEVDEGKPKPDPHAFAFYGIPISATGAVFVIEGSQQIAMPADLDVQLTKWRDLWRGTRRSWEKEHPSHQAILLREFKGAAAAFPEGFRWGMVTLYGRFTFKAIGEKKLLTDKPRDAKQGVKLIEKAPEKGWCAPYQGLRTGAALGGKESSAIDTIVLWATGDPAGGRYMNADAAADAWNRFNRFRRLRVIAIRIGNRKQPAETFMKSIADASRGVSHWARKP